MRSVSAIGFPLLALIACGDKRHDQELDDAQALAADAYASGSESGTSGDSDASSGGKDAGATPSAEGGACTGAVENPASCPCDRPDAGMPCDELGTECFYGLDLCTCDKDSFRCSLPLPP